MLSALGMILSVLLKCYINKLKLKQQLEIPRSPKPSPSKYQIYPHHEQK